MLRLHRRTTPITSTARARPPQSTRRRRGVGRRPDHRARHLRHHRRTRARRMSAASPIRVPRRRLGADEPGRLLVRRARPRRQTRTAATTVADGRARTFLPLSRRRTAAAGRHRAGPPAAPPGRCTTPDGSLGRRRRAGPTTLGDGGRLCAICSTSAPPPAAGRSPGWSTRPCPTPSAAGRRQPAAQLVERRPSRRRRRRPTAAPSSPPTSASAGAAPPRRRPADGEPAAVAATPGWTGSSRRRQPATQVLALPYGDLDVAAAAQRRPRLYADARARAGDGARRRAGSPIDARPWSPPSGYLDDAGRRAGRPRRPPCCSPTGCPRRQAPGRRRRTRGRRLVVYVLGAPSGGPGPDDPLGAVALRQRILARPRVRCSSPGRQPLVVVLPPTGTRADRQRRLLRRPRRRWLTSPRSPADADRARRQVAPPTSSPTPPRRSAASSTRQLRRRASADPAGETAAGRAHRQRPTSRARSRDEALRHRRPTPPATTRSPPGPADRSRDAGSTASCGSIADRRAPAVIALQRHGPFAATVTNGLDQPVTVDRGDLDDRRSTITGPEPIELGRRRGAPRCCSSASTDKLGVHNVTLAVTDATGTPLGSTDELPIRSAQVEPA